MHQRLPQPVEYGKNNAVQQVWRFLRIEQALANVHDERRATLLRRVSERDVAERRQLLSSYGADVRAMAATWAFDAVHGAATGAASDGDGCDAKGCPKKRGGTTDAGRRTAGAGCRTPKRKRRPPNAGRRTLDLGRRVPGAEPRSTTYVVSSS